MELIRLFCAAVSVLTVVYGICDIHSVSKCWSRFLINRKNAPDLQTFCEFYFEYKTCLSPLSPSCRGNMVFESVNTPTDRHKRQCRYTKPEMALNGTEIVNSTDPIDLVCTVVHVTVKSFEIKWFHNGIVINHSDPRWKSKIKISNVMHRFPINKVVSHLTVMNTTVSDEGVYVCRGNVVGDIDRSLITSMKVTVQRKNEHVQDRLTFTTETPMLTDAAEKTGQENWQKQHTQVDVFNLQAELLKAQLRDQKIITDNLKLSNKKLKLQIQLLKGMNALNCTLTSSC